PMPTSAVTGALFSATFASRATCKIALEKQAE
ncbi:hypothetical protein D030_2073B, partial [Vibrio parahaemolyticus AQ3810]